MLWQYWQGYLSTPGNCIHVIKCSVKARGGTCTTGNALETRHIISGALLPVYKVLQETVERSGYGRNNENRKVDMPEVVRGVLDDGTPIVGARGLGGGARVHAPGLGGEGSRVGFFRRGVAGPHALPPSIRRVLKMPTNSAWWVCHPRLSARTQSIQTFLSVWPPPPGLHMNVNDMRLVVKKIEDMCAYEAQGMSTADAADRVLGRSRDLAAEAAGDAGEPPQRQGGGSAVAATASAAARMGSSSVAAAIAVTNARLESIRAMTAAARARTVHAAQQAAGGAGASGLLAGLHQGGAAGAQQQAAGARPQATGGLSASQLQAALMTAIADPGAHGAALEALLKEVAGRK
jgi:hypothetical protein